MINEKRISKSGSITIPSHMRRDVGMTAGDRYEIVDQGDGSFLLTRTLGSCFFCKSKELFSKGVYKWAGGSTLGSYFVSATSSHYAWAIKKLKAHQKNCK